MPKQEAPNTLERAFKAAVKKLYSSGAIEDLGELQMLVPGSSVSLNVNYRRHGLSIPPYAVWQSPAEVVKTIDDKDGYVLERRYKTLTAAICLDVPLLSASTSQPESGVDLVYAHHRDFYVVDGTEHAMEPSAVSSEPIKLPPIIDHEIVNFAREKGLIQEDSRRGRRYNYRY